MSRTSLYFLRDRAPHGAGCAATDPFATFRRDYARRAKNPFFATVDERLARSSLCREVWLLFGTLALFGKRVGNGVQILFGLIQIDGKIFFLRAGAGIGRRWAIAVGRRTRRRDGGRCWHDIGGR